MQTRRDHLQAYQFAMGRLATALVSGDPGRGESPTKRAALGSVLGAGVVVLLCAGFGVYGLISPAPTDDWRTPGSIVMDRSTGSRYLYLDGVLRPVRNYASALLIAGKDATVREVSAVPLGDTPHGPPIGIPDAPDALPAASALLSGPWTQCLRPDLQAGESVDFTPAGRTSGVPADRQLLLTGPDGKLQLLWRGVTHLVPSTATLIALRLDADQAVPAPANWLRTLPSGAPLVAPVLAGSGRAAGSVGGQAVKVGQLFTTTDGAGRSYVMTSGGLAPISATTAALLAAERGAAPVRQVGSTVLAAAPVAAPGSSPGTDLPDVLGAQQLTVGAHAAVCELQHIADSGRTVAGTLVLEHGGSGTGGPAVDVPVGGGVFAVAQEDVVAQVSNPQEYLITDQGTAYPIDSTAAALLGLGSTSPVELPQGLLDVLQRGPVLSRGAAEATVGGGS
ncbi:type VII secretion protein EccB [Streptacidiphilus jiangxiensis]|uniref:Type VII secretion protein EccB n=1 Tax=Streptacidiphilus jiangxiensis TaxID=235985 RepID=A0A1H7P6B5_STRJI|nr:type VII secretion protein EccB [Streptacidiphilus jiangxiensis]SEL31149.1 type VII secretion protein EccB [Streptacidiphilus jiangxiensis]